MFQVMFRGVTVPPDPFTIVTDYCNEGSLYHLLHSMKPLSFERQTELLLDIAKGMVHLHCSIPEKEVIHRDLAARNILLSNGRALVSDFGMARMKMTSEFAEKTQHHQGPLKWMVTQY